MHMERSTPDVRSSRRVASTSLLLAIVAVCALPAHGASLTPAPPPADAQGRPSLFAGDTTITLRSTGTDLEFLPNRISVRQGTRVTVRYVNEGTLPHNFVVVKDEGDIDTLGRAAFQAKDTNYVPLQYESKMIAHTALAHPGETVEVTFVVPPAGEYFFVCLYSGHYNMMVGTLRALG